MKKVAIVAASLAAAPALAQNLAFEVKTPSTGAEERKWALFLRKFARKYASKAEEQMRFEVFKANLQKIEERNEKSDSTFHSFLTPFADWTEREFQQYNRLRITSKTKKWHAEKIIADKQKVNLLLASESATPTNFDWREKGFSNPVQDQGQCGSCWSFATVANIEGVHQAHTGTLLKLSEQQLVDCDPEDHGCNGGLPQNADDYLITRHQGLELESDYPYTGSDHDKCKKKDALEKVFVHSIVHVDQDEDAMARAVVQHGPLSIGINATPMQWYTGGVSTPDDEQCDPTALNHGVTLVGFGVEENAGLEKQWAEHKLNLEVEKSVQFKTPKEESEAKEKFMAERRRLLSHSELRALSASTPFWTIRNSWGPNWGESGHFRIIRGKNACGVKTLVTSAEGTSAQSAVPTSEAEEIPAIWV